MARTLRSPLGVCLLQPSKDQVPSSLVAFNWSFSGASGQVRGENMEQLSPCTPQWQARRDKLGFKSGPAGSSEQLLCALRKLQH
jgi:hypothetical protein